jgi:hypothetical protein
MTGFDAATAGAKLEEPLPLGVNGVTEAAVSVAGSVTTEL